MRKILALLSTLLLATPAYADWTGKDASNTTITFKNGTDCTSGVCVPIAALVTAAGATLYGTAGTANTGVLTIQGIASMTPVGVSAASGAYASGALAAGAFAAGSAVDGWDLTQGAIADAAVTAGATGSVSAKLRAISRDIGTVATNTGAATPAGSAIIGKVGIDQTTPGTTNAISLNGGLATANQDPCTGGLKTNLPINQNGTASVQLVALSGSTKIYVCSIGIVAASATTVAITTGTGTACVTGNAAVLGSTTANIANSISLVANGGLTLGSGSGTIASGAAGGELCMVLGTNIFVSGNLTYVQQ